VANLVINDAVIKKDATKEDFELFADTLFEVMEETFPEFMWNGKLIKSTKYKAEGDEE
jgi:hypothetical protein